MKTVIRCIVLILLFAAPGFCVDKSNPLYGKRICYIDDNHAIIKRIDTKNVEKKIKLLGSIHSNPAFIDNHRFLMLCGFGDYPHKTGNNRICLYDINKGDYQTIDKLKGVASIGFDKTKKKILFAKTLRTLKDGNQLVQLGEYDLVKKSSKILRVVYLMEPGWWHFNIMRWPGGAYIIFPSWFARETPIPLAVPLRNKISELSCLQEKNVRWTSKWVGPNKFGWTPAAVAIMNNSEALVFFYSIYQNRIMKVNPDGTPIINKKIGFLGTGECVSLIDVYSDDDSVLATVPPVGDLTDQPPYAVWVFSVSSKYPPIKVDATRDSVWVPK